MMYRDRSVTNRLIFSLIGNPTRPFSLNCMSRLRIAIVNTFMLLQPTVQSQLNPKNPCSIKTPRYERISLHKI